VRVYGYILAGEIGGTAVGFLISGSVAGFATWRSPFFLLALPGVWLARELWRTLPEPQRGGAGPVRRGCEGPAAGARGGGGGERGCEELVAAARGEAGVVGADEDDAGPVREDDLAGEAVRARGVEAEPSRVLHEDSSAMSLGRAVKYILAVPTNVWLIVASAL